MEDLTYRQILVALMAVGGVAAFFLSRNRLRDGFLLFIALLGLGFRTLPVTDDLRIHPADIAIVLVAILALGTHAASRSSRLPWWQFALVPFMFLGWLPSADNPQSWDTRLAECISISLMFPVFVATRAVLAQKEAWRRVAVTFYVMATVVAILGLAEYFFPGIKNAFPGFITRPEGFEAEGGFLRASFSFYGNPLAVFLCMYALPFGLAIGQWWPKPGARLALAASALLQLAGVYISGYRSMWLLCALMAALFLMKKRWFLLLALLMVLAVGGFISVPEKIRARLDTINFLREDAPIDGSGLQRRDRAEHAFQSALTNPVGGGWGYAGWVHSDFLQVAANLGLVAGLILLAAYLETLIRLVRRQRLVTSAHPLAALGFPLLLSFVVVGQMLAVQGIEFHSFTILPMWLSWAMADTWLLQTRDMEGRL
jgi:hypothetical protein